MKTISTYEFNNEDLLKTALTHSSYANEHAVESYERLEFLGDSILGFVVAEYLYCQSPEIAEGKMTSMRSLLVREATLKEVAVKLGIPQLMRLSRGEEKNGGRTTDSILADMVESVIAAIYLDGGFEEARKFIYSNILTEKISDSDNKSALQETVQKNGQCDIRYIEESESGPDHDKTFSVSVFINGEKYGTGSGKSKQLAQQSAAGAALKKWQEKE